MPGPIDTEIWDIPGNEPALHDIPKVPAAECAAGIADAMADDGFEYYVPPVYPGGIGAKDLALGKVQDCDNYLKGFADMARAAATARTEPASGEIQANGNHSGRRSTATLPVAVRPPPSCSRP